MLCAETVWAHFDPTVPRGVSCDGSELGVGAASGSHSHRNQGGNEQPIADASKTLAESTDSVHSAMPYVTGQPCYARVFTPRGDGDPKWVPGFIT